MFFFNISLTLCLQSPAENKALPEGRLDTWLMHQRGASALCDIQWVDVQKLYIFKEAKEGLFVVLEVFHRLNHL